MITHIVLLRFQPTADQEQLLGARDALASLEGRVPQLRSLSVGVNVLSSGRAFDIGLIATFDDLDGLAAYRAHPEHVAVADAVDQHCASVVSVDYES